MSSPGLIIAAAASGSGKTTLTLGLLRLLARQGVKVRGCKTGPDYIDPAFHAAASGHACFNLDPWAMRADSLAAIVDASQPHDLTIVEGVMGLFDGAAPSIENEAVKAEVVDLAAGSTAQLAALTGWPVVVVLNVKGQGATAAAIARGLLQFHPQVRVAGVICNNVGSARHGEILRHAFAQVGIPLLGLVLRDPRLHLPDRHLGLVQAGEHADLQRFLDNAADHLERHVDVAALRQVAAVPAGLAGADLAQALLPPLGRHIAVASDIAFAFAYSAQLAAWRAAGAEISCFSPLADEAPSAAADAVFLPGGYPELHAETLAGNKRFIAGLRQAAADDKTIYGECGGYMVLGRALTDARGVSHPMLDLLPVETSFATRKLHLGYRQIELAGDTPFGATGAHLRGHEFHYASIVAQSDVDRLFAVRDAAGRDLGAYGHRRGKVFGSYLHLIDRAA
ncbi:MAG TPA: cobyrinate a,c-diamide synthase [Dongiaceae bacterium]|nr:cobyrinate a,c-diamide synthase [Dongiaceae bacterium]